jgi:hypothetical protein
MNAQLTLPKTLMVIFIIILLYPGCKEDKGRLPEIWSTYSKKDRQAALNNGCPYWYDILKECFPIMIDGKVLDRIALRSIPQSLPWAYYDPMGRQFAPKKYKAPDQFSGYILSFKYIGIEDKYPLKLMIFYSEPGVDKWLQDIKKGIDIEKYSVADFTVYHGRLTPGTIKIKWAFLDDCFCVMHRIEDVQYKVKNAERFDKLLEMIETDCILSQIPH